jgi:hypothetical protein
LWQVNAAAAILFWGKKAQTAAVDVGRFDSVLLAWHRYKHLPGEQCTERTVIKLTPDPIRIVSELELLVLSVAIFPG